MVGVVDPMPINKKALRKYVIPDYIKQRFWKDHAQNLTAAEVDLVFDTMKDFMFLSKIKPSYLSSYIVDEAWHTFILFTKDYHKFCKKVFGSYFHHTPSISNGGYKSDITYIKNTFFLMKKHLPKSKLFILDQKLKIKGSKSKGILKIKEKKNKFIVILNGNKIGSF